MEADRRGDTTKARRVALTDSGCSPVGPIKFEFRQIASAHERLYTAANPSCFTFSDVSLFLFFFLLFLFGLFASLSPEVSFGICISGLRARVAARTPTEFHGGSRRNAALCSRVITEMDSCDFFSFCCSFY